MAQEPGDEVTPSEPQQESTTTTKVTSSPLGGGGDRNSKASLNLTIAPPTSLDLDLERNNKVSSAGDNGSVASDQVFVEGSAGALKVPKGPVLSAQEEEYTKEFLEIVNGARVSKGVSPLSWNAGVKFLMARKFNVRRALDLYNQHQVSRHDEGLVNFDPDSEPLKSELASGKFTVLPTRDLGGAAIAIFTAKFHNPSVSPHDLTLKGVVYQLDAALEDPQTQRSGLIFIYDMSDSKYSNFDYDLSIKILSLLKGGYPARLKKVLIVTAPLWFRAPFRILRLFVREKLRDRVFTVSIPQLGVHIPNNALPRSLGGQLELNHSTWLAHCHQILSTTDLWGSFTDDTIPFDQFSDNNDLSMEENGKDGESVPNGLKKMRRNGTSTSQSTPSPIPNSSGSSGFSDDDSLPFEEKAGLTLLEFVEHVKQKGRRGLLDEYAEIVSKSPEGSFETARLRGNVSKNRYSDVLCFDHTRVVLRPESTEGETTTDYINANYVDGYKQKNAFICTQGPLPRTFGDFWKMVWEQSVLVVVMTTRAVERGRTKCGQYWPPDQDSTVTHEEFRLKNLNVDVRPDFAVTKLLLTNVKTNESREISHLQFLSWPDYGVPSSAAATLKFIQTMRDEQAARLPQLGEKWDGHSLGPPIVVHCSAGIGRTGTLCTMDISLKRIVDQKTVDVMGTVERIRSQRAYSIQVPEQYLFCHAAVIEYALSNGLLTEDQLEGMPDLLAEALQLALERERQMYYAEKAAEEAAAAAAKIAATSQAPAATETALTLEAAAAASSANASGTAPTEPEPETNRTEEIAPEPQPEPAEPPPKSAMLLWSNPNPNQTETTTHLADSSEQSQQSEVAEPEPDPPPPNSSEPDNPNP